MVEVNISKKMEKFHLQVAFESEEKQIGILGASGCGKSMMLQCIAGILTPDTGRIVVDGKVFFDSSMKINLPARDRKTGYLFQNYALFPHMNVLENIMSGMGKGTWNRQEKRIRGLELIGRFGLEGLEERLPLALSGGQQQRVAFARMMAYEPSVILLDEPFSAVDGFMKEKMQDELTDLIQDYTGSVFMVSHSRDEIYRFSNLLLMIVAGKQQKAGLTRELFNSPAQIEVARLTGCENIVRMKKIATREIFVPEWGIRLKTTKEVREEVKYVGIRAHDITEGKEDDENTYLMKAKRVYQKPFEYKYGMYLVEGNSLEPIWWKTTKYIEHKNEKRQESRYISLPANKLLLLTD